MNTNQHTPGPWTVTPYLTPEREDDPMGVYKVEPACEQITQASHVLDPEEDDNFEEMVHERNEANARLIAAAPELLEACEALLEAYAPNANMSAFQCLHSSVKKAITAIGKAKGEPYAL